MFIFGYPMFTCMNLLLVGVGGVGCEFLIQLSESECAQNDIKIVIIDDDLVEESNLHRQRLYKAEDIGKAKVEAACEKLNCSRLQIISLKCKVEDIKDLNFFSQFQVFILAVDSLETRRWMNSTVIQCFKGRNDWWLLDMGVQGFKFSLRSVRSDKACLECTMSLYTADDQDDEEIAVCSVYGKPRDLKDCVYWTLNHLDNSGDLDLIFRMTERRAEDHLINSDQLNFDFIERLMKRAVPAVASVNSLLASQGLSLLFRHINGIENEHNFYMTNLENGYYEMKVELERDHDCFICKN